MVQFLYTSTQVMAQAQDPGFDLRPTTVIIGQANETVTPPSDNNNDYGPLILDVGQHVKISRQNAGLGSTLILIGLIQVFFGFKFIRLTLFLTGFISWGKQPQYIKELATSLDWNNVFEQIGSTSEKWIHKDV